MMPAWRRRVLAYRALGGVPGGERLLDWYRPRFGRLKSTDLHTRDGALAEMMRLLRGAGRSVEGKNLIEIGTGWHPLLPVLFYGLGAETVVMTDIVRHVRGDLIEQVLDFCTGHSRELAEISGRDEASMNARWSALRPDRGQWVDLWRAHGITYRAPFDFTRSGLPAQSVDMIFSNDCLGYIPVPTLAAIMKESWRLLRPGGIIAHDIFVYDDLGIYDREIPPWNFLRFSQAEWDRVGNSRIHHQNRSRPSFYARLAVDNGLQIVYEERVLPDLREDDLDRSTLHPDFRELPFDEIACNHYLLAAEKPTGGPPPEPTH